MLHPHCYHILSLNNYLHIFNKLRNLLIISFDLINEGEPEISFSIASILASLKSDYSYKKDFDFHHISFNLLANEDINADSYLERIKQNVNYNDFDSIALSVYVWSESIINSLIIKLKKDGYLGKIILGGNQITNDVFLEKIYPDCDIFIIGYAEGIIKKAVIEKYEYPIRLEVKHNMLDFKSPYIMGIYSNDLQYSNLRTETKRGCLFNCDYCGHVDLQNKGIIHHSYNRVIEDIKILKELQVERINIIDPIFTLGNNFLNYLDEIYKNRITSKIKLQSRFEFFSNNKNDEIFEKLKNINSHIEFGVQTVFKKEADAIGRHSVKKIITEGVKNLTDAGISFEVSIIYGLPFQTLYSFNETIRFLEDIGCVNIKAFPLMLLRGTKMYINKQKLGLKEKNIGKLQIPYVTESFSFSEKEWIKMNELVNLKFNQNVI
ncbi:MAG: hypothetical protein IEMM0006_1637 [bacterium]|nr:MAG: hypothetical protein IEMM0006_1637 [bacterium]